MIKNILSQNETMSSLIWKISIGSALSWELSRLFGSEHPYLAPLSVIICIQATMDKTISIGIQRIIGTVIGIPIIVIIASHLNINGWNLGLLILLGGYISKWLKLDQGTLHQVVITILLVFVFEKQTEHYALDRMKDTLIGVMIAVFLQFIWFPFKLKQKQ
ncbi:FUSC family protein [Bacillus massiliigorillae]|uniref:FUSC family protein n=1 Tax=Bacillus massiliigorillae TaxID=1243664 RepID=UPI0003A74A80|nr:FUSC family protein [Bacillus massiliigorillae]